MLSAVGRRPRRLFQDVVSRKAQGATALPWFFMLNINNGSWLAYAQPAVGGRLGGGVTRPERRGATGGLRRGNTGTSRREQGRRPRKGRRQGGVGVVRERLVMQRQTGGTGKAAAREEFGRRP